MKKIHRRRKCGCGNITNPGKKWINEHNWAGKNLSEITKSKMSLAHKGYEHSKATKLKMSLAHLNMSKATKLKMSLAKIKYDPNYEYYDIWKDREYLKDIRKDYCENKDCKSNYKQLCNHHIYLDKKRCAPQDIITLCISCHMILHRLLEKKKNEPANPKNYIIINRPGRVSYVHKKSRRIIRIERKSP